MSEDTTKERPSEQAMREASEAEEVVEPSAVEDPTPAPDEAERFKTPEVREVISTDLEVRPPAAQVLQPLDPEQVIEGMERYQEMLPKLLDDSDYQDAGKDSRTGKPRRFVKKSGWRKIARAFNLSTMVVSLAVERDDEGNPLRAEAVVRAMAPNGAVSDADGYCSTDEERFQKASGKKKLENDMRATATTRAKNRAISDLVGMGEVSAEEVEGGAGFQLPEADADLKKRLSTALGWWLPNEEGERVWGEVKQLFGGKLPQPVAEAVMLPLRARRDLEAAEAEQDKAGE